MLDLDQGTGNALVHGNVVGLRTHDQAEYKYSTFTDAFIFFLYFFFLGPLSLVSLISLC
jgi:hypothetical protein